MIEYPKIQSLFKRDDKGNFTSDLSKDEFAYLFANEWVGTEKIDGTNIRIGYNPEIGDFEVKGRTDKAQIPEFLKETLDMYISCWRNKKFEETFPDLDAEVILFGEGYGEKIQKNGKKYTGSGTDFILFDVKIGNWWLKREDVEKVADSLSVKVVPTLFKGALSQAMDLVAEGFTSQVAREHMQAEGLVLTPSVPLFERNGSRIITKLKTKDFKGEN